MSRPVTSPRRPPAAAAAVAEAEAILGHPLPPLLRRIYAEVAEGGFGPGTGLFPLGDASEGLVSEYELVCEASDHGYGMPWPRHLLPVATWSDGTMAMIDLTRPPHPVFAVDFADAEDEHARPWEVEPAAPSLAVWLHRWLTV